ncbi:Integrase catalytic region [Sulfobacillus acidophilus DSM 10332]|uniref:Integrase catalytic region n=1 Tax=Sulfobacillus acidophilus (strain ATCC 700253 / DSM 10332 / NAL) TaxID=679936 RepID=G8TZY9_SULAD|nr:Integrase catalytic region [Sulfobacillus acidophilus DSM 10332]
MTNAERDAWALFRYRLISPLLDPAVSAADRAAYWAFLRDHPPTTPDGQVWVPSSRSIQRYCAAYRAGGLDALRPQRRRDHGTRRAFSDPLWVQAVALKREVPERSADQVMALLRAWAPTAGLDAGLVDRMRRSTLYRHWASAGITRRRLRTAAPKRYRRWEAPEPGALWQSDIMNGPYLPDPTPEDPQRKRPTYCWVLMDDYSRRIVAGQFAWQADLTVLEDLLWEALQRWGAPQRLYVDNGGPYSSDRLATICARLNIRLIHATPYEPAGKGKQERLWGHVQSSFLPELRAQPADSLGQLNTWFQAWCEEHYHRRVHSETGEPPLVRWGRGGCHRPLSWEALRAAFRVEVTRRVDKTGQLRWAGHRWVVPEGLLQAEVQLRFDPHQPDTIDVWYHDAYDGRAVRADQLTQPPAADAPSTPPASTGLSYLTVLEARQRARRPAGLRYRPPEEEGPL